MSIVHIKSPFCIHGDLYKTDMHNPKFVAHRLCKISERLYKIGAAVIAYA
jgi:hypothetical protein